MRCMARIASRWVPFSVSSALYCAVLSLSAMIQQEILNNKKKKKERRNGIVGWAEYVKTFTGPVDPYIPIMFHSGYITHNVSTDENINFSINECVFKKRMQFCIGNWPKPNNDTMISLEFWRHNNWKHCEDKQTWQFTSKSIKCHTVKMVNWFQRPLTCVYLNVVFDVFLRMFLWLHESERLK